MKKDSRFLPPVKRVIQPKSAIQRIRTEHVQDQAFLGIGNQAVMPGSEPGEARYKSRPMQIRQRREAAAMRIQQAFRAYKKGQQTRQHYRVQSDPDVPGIVHTRVHGTAEYFEPVGFQVENRKNRFGVDKGKEDIITMNIMSIDPNRFQGSVQGGKKLATAEQVASGLKRPKGSPTAYINASYYNYASRGDPDQPEFLPIGETRAGGKNLKSLPVPEPYLDKYSQFQPEGSQDKVTSAPVLTSTTYGPGGHRLDAGFTALDAGEERFKYRDPDGYQYPKALLPGYLHHAGDPNDRAVISWPTPTISSSSEAGKHAEKPDFSAKQDRVRMMTVQVPRILGGFTMLELSKAATRITSWNKSGGSALNLDGGGSASMGVIKPDGSSQAYGGYHGDKARKVSTIITYQRKPDKRRK